VSGLGRWRKPGSQGPDPAGAACRERSAATPIRPSAVAQLLAIAASIDAGEPEYRLAPGGAPEQSAAASADLRWLADHGLIRAGPAEGGRTPPTPAVASGLTQAGARAIGRELDRNAVLLPRAG
jgi:hypothetical protein